MATKLFFAERKKKLFHYFLDRGHPANDVSLYSFRPGEDFPLMEIIVGDRTSFLNPVWYAGSLAIGAFAGAIGDKWSLGFLAETEHQVVRHLDEHLKELPKQDQRSRAILEQMKTDEARHATTALDHGAAGLPAPVKGLMSLMSKVMTNTTYKA